MSWFHDPRGVYFGQAGGIELELLLLRREIAAGQKDLLRKRGEHKGLEKVERKELAEVIPMKESA